MFYILVMKLFGIRYALCFVQILISGNRQFLAGNNLNQEFCAF